jgi:hypothetical protein
LKTKFLLLLRPSKIFILGVQTRGQVLTTTERLLAEIEETARKMKAYLQRRIEQKGTTVA